MSEAAPLPPGTRPAPNPDPRDAAVEAFAAELRDFLGPLIKRHAITSCEYLFVIGTLSVRQVQSMCIAERAARSAAEVPL